MKTIGLIDPSINSFNLGDQIVMKHIMDILIKVFPDAFFINVPAYGTENERTEEIVRKCELFIFCGTGPICSDITFRWPIQRWQYDRKVIFLGIGANSYDVDITIKAKQIYESNLSKDYRHSARDNFSKSVIDAMGINYLVYNTGCPTLWNIQSDLIYKHKTKNVLLTLNSSRQNYKRDFDLINFLQKHYEQIYFYAQCPNDMDYLNSLNFKPDAIIPSNLPDIDNFMSNTTFDYIGHRLHGGIHALHHGNRAFIVAVDNRASEMGKDFNLPVFNLDYSLKFEVLEKAIYDTYNLELNLPKENINRWMDQFNV